MPLDPDNVRVDLLRIKRKLYISYPEGSKERQDFLLASKLSELTYLQKLVSPDIVEEVFREYDRQVRLELFNILTSFMFGLIFSVMLFGFHQLYPTSSWLSLFPLPCGMGIGFASLHVWHLIDQKKKFMPFQQEYETLRKKILKLTEELKGLSK